jgi:4-amino-4-deoxy-L-arabinose transferase-like glycosyltransferase
MRKNDLILLLLIFLIAYLLRVLFLPGLSLTFGYDQARDAYMAQQIISGHLKILGPPASAPGLYHGVFYYYVLAVGYLFGKNPIIAAYWIALLNAGTVFVIFYLTYLLTKNKTTALISSFLFAISFEASQYATWLSNPTIAVWTIPLMYLGLWTWTKERKPWGTVLAGIGLGLSIQSEIFLLYHSVPVFAWVFLNRRSINRKELTRFFTFLLISLSTMILAEFKFGFRGIPGIMSLLGTQDTIVASHSLGDFLILYLNQLGRVFAFSAYPENIGYGGAIVLAILIYSLYKWNKKKLTWEPFLGLWVLGHITVVSVGGTSTPFLLVGVAPGICILVGIFIKNFWDNKYKIIPATLLLVITLGNITMILKENSKGQTIFAIQKDMVLSKQLSAIDYTYKESNGNAFSINSLTSPLWVNIVWSYLYNWYGQEKFGYVPSWHGRSQIGLVSSLGETPKEVKNYYLIIEPPEGIPIRYLDETIKEEDSKSSLLDERYFGELRIQKRIKL